MRLLRWQRATNRSLPAGRRLTGERLLGALLTASFAPLALAASITTDTSATAGAAALPHASGSPTAAVQAGEDSPRWRALRDMLYAGREVLDGSGHIELTMPYRAHDAATVPVAIRVTEGQSAQRYVKTVTLLIDENPSPIAGRFHFTPMTGNASLETRVRVNAYTNVRAIAEMSTGELYMSSQFVKASGGCSAPAMKDQAAALARIGKIKLRQSPALEAGQPSVAQLMVSHPNSTGMQMDQVTHHYVPAHFVRSIDVRYGGEPIMRVEGDISLSEDPNIRFHFLPRAGAELEVEVRDTQDNVFERSLEVPAPAT